MGEMQGLPRNSKDEFGSHLVEGADWSFADGRPGVPSLGQLDRMNKQKKYAMEIKAALDVVKEFQAANINSEREAEEQSRAIQESRLKKKGNIDLRSKS